MSTRRQRSTPITRTTRPRWQRVSGWYVQRPRWLRAVVSALSAISLTLLVSPLVDSCYLNYFFSVQTRVLPSLISTAVGVVWYVVGWRLTMSVEAEDAPPLRGMAWYLLLGTVSLLLVIVLMVYGLISGNAPT